MSNEPVPKDAMDQYHMLWQLETWMRTLVYVVLRTVRVDWEHPIKEQISKWPPDSLKRDKQLTHMKTPHQSALSYLTFGDLWKVISASHNWQLFEAYFPPKANTEARIDEVKAIRNRTAHFRQPHKNDCTRLALFLRDMESGIRDFCAQYSSVVAADDDPVVAELQRRWNVIGHAVEMMLSSSNDWLYAPHHRRANPLLNASLSIATLTASEESLSRRIYRLTIHPSLLEVMDFVHFLKATRPYHERAIHLMPTDREITVTIPGVLGVEQVVESISAYLRCGLDCRNPARQSIQDVQHEWPEYVLAPDHILTFFDESMSEPILVVPS